MKNILPHYKIDKAKNQQSVTTPWLIFGNALGCNLSMWEPAVEKLSAEYNILRYDLRGFGNSENYVDPFTIADLAHDVILLINELKISPAVYIGLSMGGLISQHLAINYPQYFSKMVISNSGAKLGTADTWRERAIAVEKNGVAGLIEGIIPRWFTDKFVEKQYDKIIPFINMLKNCNDKAYLAHSQAIAAADYREEIKKINIPTLIIGSSFDGSTPIELAKYLYNNIKNSQFVELPSAHLSCVECADEFAINISNFLNS